MKSILISIKPKYVADILNGRKTIEIRKNMPKCELPITVYIYCTKEKPHYLVQGGIKPMHSLNPLDPSNYSWGIIDIDSPHSLNGKVVAKFTLKKVEEIDHWFAITPYFEQTCLTTKELTNYLGADIGYAWHISNLVIFDKPKELSEFKTRHYPQFAGMVKNKTHYELIQLTKAPQSWAYIESEE